MWSINRTQQPRGNKQRGWTEGRELASISTYESPRLASPGVLGRGGLEGLGVSGTPPPSSTWGNWLSSSECPFQRDAAGLCRTRVDGAESQPGGCCCYTCNKQHGAMDGQLAWEPGHLGPDSDSATQRATLDMSFPFLASFLLYDERVGLSRGTVHSLLSSTLRGLDQPWNCDKWPLTSNRRDGAATLMNHRLGQWAPQVSPPWTILLLKHRGISILLEVSSQCCVQFDLGK